MSNLDYIKNLKNQTQKKKSVTITIDEQVLDTISEIADSLEISKNQIISDISANFVADYEKSNNPNYYIINSNNYYMPEGHLHMLLGNRASAWRDAKTVIEGLVPGDYVFIFMNGTGIIASGTVKSKFMSTDYSLVKYYDRDANKDDPPIEYMIWDENYVTIDFDKKSLIEADEMLEINQKLSIDEERVLLASEFHEKISKKPFNRTKISLTEEEGKKLKDIFLSK